VEKKTMKRCSLAVTLSIAVGSLAAGCGTTPDTVTSPTAVASPRVPAPPTLPADHSSCTASKAQWAIGRAATDDLLKQARVAANATVARFIVQGQPITTEYLGTRLNLEVDVQRVVVAVRCG
jgi:hypothetical protein